MADQLSLHQQPSPKSTLDPDLEKSMPSTVTIHREHHKYHGDLVRDSIIGFSDGLTVPFALTAGLSSLGSTKIVILGGLAELFAGSISMGLGAFLASVTDRKHYEVEEAREKREVKEMPAEEEEEIYEIFEKYGIQRHKSKGVIEGLKVNEEMWVQVRLPYRLSSLVTRRANYVLVHDGLRTQDPEAVGEEVLDRRACDGSFVLRWCVTYPPTLNQIVALTTITKGGLLPMIPYFIFMHRINTALYTSIGVTAAVLIAFGFTKAKLTGTSTKDAWFGAAQTLLIGGVAAGVSYGVVRGVNGATSL